MSDTPAGHGLPGEAVARQGPPSFAEGRSRREKARVAGLHPDHWYAVEYDRSVKRGQVVEVRFWNTSIALYRGTDGVPRAIENRCAHRQIKLTLGTVNDCRLTCAYHGWSYDDKGRLAHVPHDLFGHPMPDTGVGVYPVRVRYGLIWIFPGDPAIACERTIPDIPELEGPDRWACVPVDFVWRAHHSIIVDNVSDFTHAWLHRKYRPFDGATLTRCETVGDRVHVSYTTQVGRGRFSRLFVDRRRVNTNAMSLCYEYPYQWSDTDGKIKHWAFFLPIDERTTRTFFLFYFESLKIPLTRFRSPRAFMPMLLAVANQVLIKPLLRQDGVAVEAEQEGWEAHFARPMPELNPAVGLFQQLTVRRWEEHLADARPVPSVR